MIIMYEKTKISQKSATVGIEIEGMMNFRQALMT